MLVLRYALLAGALIASALAARRIVTGHALLPIPLGVWLVAIGVCSIGYLGSVFSERVIRHLDRQLSQHNRQREQHEVELLVEGLEVVTATQSQHVNR